MIILQIPSKLRSLVCVSLTLILPLVLAVSGGANANSESRLPYTATRNNEGVKILSSGNYEAAIKILQQILESDRDYDLAKTNLSVAYVDSGKKLVDYPVEALKQFHKAIFVDEDNSAALHQIDATHRAVIKQLRSSPRS